MLKLLRLIAETESMDDYERKYWTELLPRMTESHIQKLTDILQSERNKLYELEAKYQEEIRVINNEILNPL